MSEPLKGKILFNDTEQSLKHQEQVDIELTAKVDFSQQNEFLPQAVEPLETETDQALTQILANKPKRRYRGLKTLLTAGAIMAGWQTVTHVTTAYQSGDWLSLGWSAIVAGLAIVGISALGREWVNLRRLKQRQHERDQAQQLLTANGIGKGKAFCVKLAKQSHIPSDNHGYDRWLHALAATHNDREVLELYDRMVISQQDKLARKLVAKYASEAALMVALSPLAIADMLLVAWRNFRLIEQVSAIYGVELSYWSRIKLVKLVLANMAFAGGTEVIADLGMDMLSMDLAGRMSTRVAQGVGVGLLTGRLGLKAMNLMRPLPWLVGEQPKLSEIRRDLLSQLSHKDKA